MEESTINYIGIKLKSYDLNLELEVDDEEKERHLLVSVWDDKNQDPLILNLSPSSIKDLKAFLNAFY